MQDDVGIVRNAQELERAIGAVAKLRERAGRTAVPGNRHYNAGWHTAQDLRNLLTTSEIIARAALERKESRGAHTREDFPNKEEAFGKVNIIIRQGADGEPAITQEPIHPLTPELKQIIEEMG